MLRQLRSEKFKKGLMLAVILIVVPSFVVFYGWESGRSQQGDMTSVAAKLKLDTLGKVEVGTYDLTQARKLLSQRYESYAQENQITLDPGARERLLTSDHVAREAVNVKLLQEFGAKHGIVVSDPEVEKFVQDTFPPQIRASIPQQVERMGMTVDQWLESLKYDMLLGKIREVLSARTRISYYEAWLEYLLRNEKLIADYSKFDLAEYLAKVQPKDEELNQYFEANKAKFEIPDQYQYAYILVSRNDLRSSVTVAEDDITSYYTNRQEDFRLPRSVKARQIFLEKPAVEDANTTAADGGTTGVEAARAKATELYQRIAKGENFAELADTFTQEKVFPPQQRDENTTASDAETTAGGNLGFILETTAKSFYGDEWTSAVMAMQPGAVSEPIETRRGFYVVKLENKREGVVQSLEKVRDIIRDRIISEKVTPLFQEMGDKLRANSEKLTVLDKLAEATSLTVRMTPKVDRDAEFMTGFGRLGDFKEAISGLEKGGRSDVLSDPTRHAVIELIEEFPAHMPTFDEVREKVTDEYRRTKALELARKDAETSRDRATTLEAMQAAATELGTTVTHSQDFTRAEAGAVLGPIEDFRKESAQVKAGQTVLSELGTDKLPQGYVVWRLAEKKEPSRTDFMKELPTLTRQMARMKAEILVNEYLRDQWKKEAQNIEISKAFR